MSLDDVPEIPEQIEAIMQSGELGNMRNLCGWAVGTAVLLDEDGVETERWRNAWVELFNGEGRAGEFGGVRFMAVSDGEYEEAYAYPGRRYADGNEPCYCIESWDVPEHPDYGQPYPSTPGVTR